MIRFVQSQYDVNEGDGTAQVCMEIIAGSAPSPAITIDIDTSDIAAVGKFVILLLITVICLNMDSFPSTAPDDYTSGGYSVTFAANAGAGTQACTNIPIIDDNCVENAEGFRLSASSTDNRVSFPSGTSASVLITDNDSEDRVNCSIISVACLNKTLSELSKL